MHRALASNECAPDKLGGITVVLLTQVRMSVMLLHDNSGSGVPYGHAL